MAPVKHNQSPRSLCPNILRNTAYHSVQGGELFSHLWDFNTQMKAEVPDKKNTTNCIQFVGFVTDSGSNGIVSKISGNDVSALGKINNLNNIFTDEMGLSKMSSPESQDNDSTAPRSNLNNEIHVSDQPLEDNADKSISHNVQSVQMILQPCILSESGSLNGKCEECFQNAGGSSNATYQDSKTVDLKINEDQCIKLIQKRSFFALPSLTSKILDERNKLLIKRLSPIFSSKNTEGITNDGLCDCITGAENHNSNSGGDSIDKLSSEVLKDIEESSLMNSTYSQEREICIDQERNDIFVIDYGKKEIGKTKYVKENNCNSNGQCTSCEPNNHESQKETTKLSNYDNPFSTGYRKFGRPLEPRLYKLLHSSKISILRRRIPWKRKALKGYLENFVSDPHFSKTIENESPLPTETESKTNITLEKNETEVNDPIDSIEQITPMSSQKSAIITERTLLSGNKRVKRTLSKASLGSRTERSSSCGIMSISVNHQKVNAPTGKKNIHTRRAFYDKPRLSTGKRCTVRSELQASKPHYRNAITRLAGNKNSQIINRPIIKRNFRNLASKTNTFLNQKQEEILRSASSRRTSSKHRLTSAHKDKILQCLPSKQNCRCQIRRSGSRILTPKYGRNAASTIAAVLPTYFSEPNRKRSVSRDCASKASRSRSPPLTADGSFHKQQKRGNSPVYMNGRNRKGRSSQNSKSPSRKVSRRDKFLQRAQSASFRNICNSRNRRAFERKCFSGINDRVVSWMSLKSNPLTRSKSTNLIATESEKQLGEATDAIKKRLIQRICANDVPSILNVLKRKTPKRKSRRSVYLEKHHNQGKSCSTCKENETTDVCPQMASLQNNDGEISKSKLLACNTTEKSSKHNIPESKFIAEVSKHNLTEAEPVAEVSKQPLSSLRSDIRSPKQKATNRITNSKLELQCNPGSISLSRQNTVVPILSNCTPRSILSRKAEENRSRDRRDLSPLVDSKEIFLLDDIIFLESSSPENASTSCLDTIDKHSKKKNFKVKNSLYFSNTRRSCLVNSIVDIDEISYNPRNVRKILKRKQDINFDATNKEISTLNIGKNENEVLSKKTCISCEYSKQLTEGTPHSTDKTRDSSNENNQNLASELSKTCVTTKNSECCKGANSASIDNNIPSMHVDNEQIGVSLSSKTLTLRSGNVKVRQGNSCAKITNFKVVESDNANDMQMNIKDMSKACVRTISCISKTSSINAIEGKRNEEKQHPGRLSNIKLQCFNEAGSKHTTDTLKTNEPTVTYFFDNFSTNNQNNSLSEIYGGTSTTKGIISKILNCHQNKNIFLECRTISNKNITSLAKPNQTSKIEHCTDFSKEKRDQIEMAYSPKNVKSRDLNITTTHKRSNKDMHMKEIETFKDIPDNDSINLLARELLENIKDFSMNSHTHQSKAICPLQDLHLNKMRCRKHKLYRRSTSSLIRGKPSDSTDSDSSENIAVGIKGLGEHRNWNKTKRRKVYHKSVPKDLVINYLPTGSTPSLIQETRDSLPPLTTPPPPPPSPDAITSLSERTDDSAPVSGTKRKSVSFKIPINENAAIKNMPSIHFSETQCDYRKEISSNDQADSNKALKMSVKSTERSFDNLTNALSRHNTRLNDYSVLNSQFLTRMHQRSQGNLSGELKIGHIQLRSVARKNNSPLIIRQEKLRRTKIIHRYGRNFSSKAPVWYANGDICPIESSHNIGQPPEQQNMTHELSKRSSCPLQTCFHFQSSRAALVPGKSKVLHSTQPENSIDGSYKNDEIIEIKKSRTERQKSPMGNLKPASRSQSRDARTAKHGNDRPVSRRSPQGSAHREHRAVKRLYPSKHNLSLESRKKNTKSSGTLNDINNKNDKIWKTYMDLSSTISKPLKDAIFAESAISMSTNYPSITEPASVSTNLSIPPPSTFSDSTSRTCDYSLSKSLCVERPKTSARQSRRPSSKSSSSSRSLSRKTADLSAQVQKYLKPQCSNDRRAAITTSPTGKTTHYDCFTMPCISLPANFCG